jgi:ribonuclease HI
MGDTKLIGIEQFLRRKVTITNIKPKSAPHVESTLVTLDQLIRRKTIPKLDSVSIKLDQGSTKLDQRSSRSEQDLPVIIRKIPKPSFIVPQTSIKEKIKLIAYCDGSTYGNGSKSASGGIGIYFGENDPKNVSEPFLDSIPNNQKTELLAMARTIEIINHVIDNDPFHYYECEIHSDSEYVINSLLKWMSGWIKNNWISSKGKPIKHIELQKRMASAYNRHKRQIKVTHVTSHTGQRDVHSIGNDKADALAKLGSQQHPNYRKKPKSSWKN